MKKKVFLLFGTRPEAIKMASLIKELEKFPDEFEVRLAVTAQHREMLDQVLNLFKIEPHYDLNVMRHGQTLFDISAKALRGLEKVIKKEKPKIVLVQGDTTTTFIGALAAFYLKIPVGHVEAGLRTFNKYSPFPEEINRRLTSHIAEFHFAPTQRAKENLLREGIPAEKIFVTGNTVIDALLEVIKKKPSSFYPLLSQIDFTKKRIVLVTAHRRESWEKAIGEICQAMFCLAERFRDIEIIFSVHKNPKVQKTVKKLLSGKPRVHLVEPMDYLSFCQVMARSYLILSDSGGIQEEAPSLGIPVLVLRDVTERPEGVEVGTVKIAGTNSQGIFSQAARLLSSKSEYRKMAKAVNPYGDGKASKRIVEILRRVLE